MLRYVTNGEVVIGADGQANTWVILSPKSTVKKLRVLQGGIDSLNRFLRDLRQNCLYTF